MSDQRQFALVGADNEVKQVIVADPSFIAAYPAENFSYLDKDGNQVLGGPGSRWVETSTDGLVTKHYAGIGHEFHEDIGEFIPKKKHASWVRDNEKAEWKAPVEQPKDGKIYKWDEAKKSWDVDLEAKDRKDELDRKDKAEKEEKDKKAKA